MNSNLVFLILMLSGLIGGMLSFVIKHENQSKLNYLLLITGSYILSIILIHLLPHCIEEYHIGAMIWVTVGFFLQLVLQQFSHGVEHGHAHVHTHIHKKDFLLICAGLILHAFFEGIPLAESGTNNDSKFLLLCGIAIHKLPESFALACLASHAFVTMKSRITWIILFSLVTPLAYWSSLQVFQHSFISNEIIGKLFSIVVGMMLQISATIIFESTSKSHMLKIKNVFFIILGFILALIPYFF